MFSYIMNFIWAWTWFQFFQFLVQKMMKNVKYRGFSSIFDRKFGILTRKYVSNLKLGFTPAKNRFSGLKSRIIPILEDEMGHFVYKMVKNRYFWRFLPIFDQKLGILTRKYLLNLKLGFIQAKNRFSDPKKCNFYILTVYLSYFISKMV